MEQNKKELFLFSLILLCFAFARLLLPLHRCLGHQRVRKGLQGTKQKKNKKITTKHPKTSSAAEP